MAVGPADRLLAEAVRALEQDGAAPCDEAAAEALARTQGGNLETRIVGRGRALSVASPLRGALRVVRTLSAWTLGVAVVIAALAGAAAVRAALGGPGGMPVNVFWVLLSLLGVQTLLLCGWLMLMIGRPAATSVAPLGAATLTAGRWLTARVHHGPYHMAAVQAYGGGLARGAVGRWTLSAITHAMWLSFNIGGVVLLLALLSTRQYAFQWETTILSSDAYERVTRAIAWLPETAGFPTPTREQILATERGRVAADPNAARAWSGLLVGSLLAYGLAPRLLLLGLSLSRRRRAWAGFRLDTTAPGHYRLRARLMPEAEASGVVPDREADDGAGATAAVAQVRPSPSAGGPPAIVGFELEPPGSPWPPPLQAMRWVDLGFVDGRDDRRRVRHTLAEMTDAPRLTAVAVALTATPDRGVGAFLEQLRSAPGGPLALLLTGGDVLRRRAGPEQMARRADGWRQLGATVGIPADRVLEIDLDHVTDASLRRLADLVGVTEPEPDGARIEPAFLLIADAVGTWRATPDVRVQADLHRKIAALYRRESPALGALLGLRGRAPVDLMRSIPAGAAWVGRVLPQRLRVSPRWVAAGAAAGALGCLAIGALVTPAALAALPTVVAGGAGVGALLDRCRGVVKEDTATAGERVDDAVRAAALFALLLGLQGRDEAEISRVLDRALPDADEPGTIGPGETGACARWLGELRHRFECALAEEAGS